MQGITSLIVSIYIQIDNNASKIYKTFTKFLDDSIWGRDKPLHNYGRTTYFIVDEDRP
jgi:hypothetical protein